MLNIYDAEGLLDRRKVLGTMEGILDTLPIGTADSRRAYSQLADLLDECSEGYTHDPLTAPSMVRDYIRSCKRQFGAGPWPRIGE